MAEAEHVDILIVGAGAAGQAAVEAAVEAVRTVSAARAGNGPRAPVVGASVPGAARGGAPLSIALISGEDRLPYKRTKISKSMAQGFERNAFAVQTEEWYREHGVELLTGKEVTRIDPYRKFVELRDRAGSAGTSVTWERLILATGAAPRLPEAEPASLDRVHRTHDIADIEGLRSAALNAVAAAPEGEKPRAVVLGGGVLGLEVCYDLHQLGLDVAVVDPNERLMHRELDAYAGELLVDECRRNGVDVYPGTPNYRVRTSKEGLAVDLPDAGTALEAHVVAAALGVDPHIRLAAEAGIRTRRGILVDGALRTSRPAVFAAGDCAEHADGLVTHLWRDAQRQGAVAGANAVADLFGRADAERPYVYEPFRLKCEVFATYFFSLCRPSPEKNDDYGHRRYYDGPRYVHAYLSRRGNAGGAATAAGDDRTRHAAEDERVAGVIMVNDKERRGRYEQAVSEGWTVHEFEAAFELR
ncbi:MAG: NAD(P)/FAD-dependent oxidoreductase [bacterium]